MHGFTESTTASNLPNVFTADFLGRLAERDEPPTAGDADVAGPWRVEPVPEHGFGLFRVGESLSRGFAPAAVFPSRWLALIAAAVLPGTGRDPLLFLSKEADADGVYPVALAGGASGGGGGESAGRFLLFDERLLDAMNVLIHLLQSPECLAYLLEAAGGVTLDRCGTILDERLAAEESLPRP
jgi:hypothetical protein